MTVASVTVFFLICAINGRLNISSAFRARKGPHSFAVLERGQKTIALRLDRPFRTLAGLIYTAGFFLAIPLLIWRYGAWRSVILIASPFAASFAIAFAMAPILGLNSEDSTAMKFMLTPAFRGTIGYMLGRHDSTIFLAQKIKAGWRQIDNVEARNKREAILAVHSQSQSKNRSGKTWLSTHILSRKII
ncbi:hypothetical protein [Paucibacter sp. B2R-40]|uniref:hypothetical protein n=1 Tax=Paucibacter sp. B2R-40 TaxID=2893554 RepID=UPI0021E447F8|nr:hypothetical protein [Paucibacter sp. B2R-40]